MKKVLIVNSIVTLLLTYSFYASAQNTQVVQQYIERYRNLAMSEQQRSGIPAAIKLAQGIHESGAGTSELATRANNHFGIKCKSNWTGETYTYTDDRPNECFRKYSLDFSSYQDHSDYLKSNPRYSFLFKLSITDYAAWAIGLRKAGYATNPNYPKLLINLIETYHLQEYTYAAMDDKALETGSFVANNTPVAQPQQAVVYRQPAASQQVQQPEPEKENVITKIFGKKDNDDPRATNPRYRGSSSAPAQPVVTRPAATPPATVAAATPAASVAQQPAAQPATTTQPRQQSSYRRVTSRRQTTNRQAQQPEQTAQEQGPSTIVKVNGLKAIYAKKGDMPLQYAVRNNIRYENLLKWNDIGEGPLPADMPLYLERKHFWGIRPMHLVKPGETMLVIAQKEGIQLKYLRDLNYMEEYEEPVPGITLELVQQASGKPRVTVVEKQPDPVPTTPIQEQNSYGSTATKDPTVTNPRYVPRDANGNPIVQEQPAAPAQQVTSREVTQNIVDNSAPAQQAYTTPVQQQPQAVATNPRYVPRNANGTPVAQQNTNTTASYSEPAVRQVRSSYTRRGQRELEQRTVATGDDEISQLKRQFDGVIYSDDPAPAQAAPASNNQVQYVERTPPPPPVEEKSKRELRREQREAEKRADELRRNTPPQVPNRTVAAPQPQEQPRTELDELKAQFDNTVYAQNEPQQQAQQNMQQSAASNGRLPVSHDPSKFYKVKRGDTAYTIAKKHDITIRQLMDWNGLDFDAIKEGQTLRIKP